MPTPLELVERVAARHRIAGAPVLLPPLGMVNEAWRIGDHILRIIQRESCDAEVATEALVVPYARAAGVRTPELVVAEVAPDLLGRPYTIYRLAEGVLMPEAGFAPTALDHCYRELGREAARIAAIDIPEHQRATLCAEKIFDPRDALAQARDAGSISPADADDVQRFLDDLEPRLVPPPRRVLQHADLHPWNLFVDAASGALTAILDWGDAALGDPAFEVVSMPLSAQAPMLEGYREGGGIVDDGFVARLHWAGVSQALWEVRKLSPQAFDPRWWRWPPGGWPVMRERMARDL